MKNITLAIDETLLAKGRELAAARKTTLNALVRSLLSHEVEQDSRIAEAKAGLRRLMEESNVDLGPNYKFNREEIYAERMDRMLSRLEHPDLRRGRKKT